MKEKEEKEVIDEILEEKPLKKEEIKKVEVQKKEYTILNISAGQFILLDEAKNGIRMSIPKEHKNAKIGDKIRI